MKKNILKRILTPVLVMLMLCIPLTTAACSQLFPDDDDSGNTSDKQGDSEDTGRNAFIEDIGGVSESFNGAVSRTSYASSDEAARAFVSEELSGADKANISSVKSGGTLTKEQINNLKIPADILDGYDTVEEMEVVYELVTATSSFKSGKVVKLSDSSNKYTVKVYVIKYGVDWKYFAPMPITGNTVNKSYYDSVFNAEKYKNCTMQTSSDIDLVISQDDESFNMSIKSQQLIKHSDGKVYMEQTVTQNTAGDVTEQTIYAYLEAVDGSIKCYLRLNETDNWMVTDITSIGFTSLEELTPFYDQYLDYTYFKKTVYGFELSDESARRYLKQALTGALDGMGLELNENTGDVDMYAEYYVSEGVLSGMRVDADVDFKVNIDESTSGTLKLSMMSNTKCTDYGTTVVNKPEV